MNAKDVLKYGQLTVQQAIDGFPATAWETTGACGTWSVKDILAHLTSYEHVLVDILAGITSSDAPIPMLNKFIRLGQRFNDVEVDLRRELSVQEIMGELSSTHTQVMDLITPIPVDMLRRAGTLPWYGLDYALDDVIVYMYYGHKREHCAQVTAFRDGLQ